MTSILVLDTAKLAEGPIDMIELLFRLRLGIHGSWFPTESLPERKERFVIWREWQRKSCRSSKISPCYCRGPILCYTSRAPSLHL